MGTFGRGGEVTMGCLLKRGQMGMNKIFITSYSLESPDPTKMKGQTLTESAIFIDYHNWCFLKICPHLSLTFSCYIESVFCFVSPSAIRLDAQPGKVPLWTTVPESSQRHRLEPWGENISPLSTQRVHKTKELWRHLFYTIGWS